MSVYLFLLGYVEILVPAAAVTDFFEACRRLGITPKKAKRVAKNGDFRCFLTRYSAKRLAACLTAEGHTVSLLKSGGLPVLWQRFCRRTGLLVGTAVAIALFIAAQLFLWDIEITGNEQLTVDEVETALAAAGLARGSFLPRLDEDAVVLSLRQGDTRIAYATVNLTGTVARVQIREAEPQPAPRSTAPANLVARRDGLVLMPLIFEGECVVSAGEYVRAGQVLASGVIDTEHGGFRVTRAAGQVLARTEETVRVTVPLSFEKKVYTGRVFYEFDLLFFSCRGKVFKNTGNIANSCDIIESEHRIFAGTHTLPVGLARTKYREYTWQTAHRTASEALVLAKAELAATLAAMADERVLLSETVETVVSESGITLVATAVFEEDIAAVAEFSVAP